MFFYYIFLYTVVPFVPYNVTVIAINKVGEGELNTEIVFTGEGGKSLHINNNNNNNNNTCCSIECKKE